MIQLVNHEGRTTLKLTCDVCDGAITHAAMAMVRWKQSDDVEEGVITNFLFCHKGSCDKQLKGERAADLWWELDAFLARLLLSTGTNLDSVKQSMFMVG